MKNNNKKGISPLIATVLIIGFTIALGAMIITWGTDFFRTTTESVDKERQNAMLCTSQLDFQLRNVDCANGRVSVENRGEVDIVALKLRFHKRADGTVTVEDKPGVAAFGISPFDIANLNELSKIDAIATVKAADGTDVVCSRAVREVTIPNPCQLTSP